MGIGKYHLVKGRNLFLLDTVEDVNGEYDVIIPDNILSRALFLLHHFWFLTQHYDTALAPANNLVKPLTDNMLYNII